METVNETCIYIAGINSPEELEALSASDYADAAVLVGEYGRLHPLVLFHRLKEAGWHMILVEILARNHNREAFETALCSASALGFTGAVLATGMMGLSPNMGKPVYDLDPSQMLVYAKRLKSEGALPLSFRLGVRAPIGSPAAEARAHYLKKAGADFLVIDQEPGATPWAVQTEKITIQRMCGGLP